MARHELRVVLETEELVEVAQTFARWANRAHELPQVLRQELLELAATPPGDLVDVKVVGGLVYEATVSPRLRALVGNLRAREGQD